MVRLGAKFLCKAHGWLYGSGPVLMFLFLLKYQVVSFPPQHYSTSVEKWPAFLILRKAEPS